MDNEQTNNGCSSLRLPMFCSENTEAWFAITRTKFCIKRVEACSWQGNQLHWVPKYCYPPPLGSHPGLKLPNFLQRFLMDTGASSSIFQHQSSFPHSLPRPLACGRSSLSAGSQPLSFTAGVAVVHCQPVANSLDSSPQPLAVSLFYLLFIRDQWFLQNFINSMCDIKFWKGNENLRSVYKKWFFEILSGFFHFWPFSALKIVHCSFQEMKTFFLWIGRMGHQKIRLFILISKMCTYDLSKKCTQKSFSQKTILPLENLPKS